MYTHFRGSLTFRFILSDAHMSFVKNWDNDIESQFYSASNEMAVLSAYPVRIS